MTETAGSGTPARILSSGDIASLLVGQEHVVLAAVHEAYLAHGQGQTSLPHSLFLRFPEAPRNRIIALPAFLGGEHPVSGMKWVASFPGNIERGDPRASAVVVLNSCETGYPIAVLEGSQISAQRTAASAALAARCLSLEPPAACSLVGAGLINFETVRFLRAVFPTLVRCVVYDLVEERAIHLSRRLESELGVRETLVVSRPEAALAASSLICFATTAAQPWVTDLSCCDNNCLILHVSLRDLAPDLILTANNVVDDRDHVCRAQTSVHLAAEQVGHRDFIWCSMDELLADSSGGRPIPDGPTIFSPFGLGILDLAVAQRVLAMAAAGGIGITADLGPPRD